MDYFLENGSWKFSSLSVCDYFLGNFSFWVWIIFLKMEGFYGVQIMVVILLGLSMGWTYCQDDDYANVSAVYIVTLKQAPVVHYNEELVVKNKHHTPSSSRTKNRLDKPLPRYDFFFFIFRICGEFEWLSMYLSNCG